MARAQRERARGDADGGGDVTRARRVQDPLGQVALAPLVVVAPARVAPTFHDTPTASLRGKVGERFSVRFEADGSPGLAALLVAAGVVALAARRRTA